MRRSSISSNSSAAYVYFADCFMNDFGGKRFWRSIPSQNLRGNVRPRHVLLERYFRISEIAQLRQARLELFRTHSIHKFKISYFLTLGLFYLLPTRRILTGKYDIQKQTLFFHQKNRYTFFAFTCDSLWSSVLSRALNRTKIKISILKKRV